MLNILMKKALAVTAGMLGTLSLLNGALVQVQQVSSPAGHLDNTQVVETGTSFKTVQPNLTSNGYFFQLFHSFLQIGVHSTSTFGPHKMLYFLGALKILSFI